MTHTIRAAITVICLGLGALAACSPKAAAPPSAVAAAPTALPAGAGPKPARHAHMVCRSSRDGRTVPCGTADAMMVGIKED